MDFHLNAYKVTMLFPIVANDGEPFSIETWTWWLDNIVSIGHYHEFDTRGQWQEQKEAHRCVVMIVSEDDLPAIETFLREARVMFAQDVMYFEAHPVHFELIE
jgi:hypothetical protein